MMDIFVPPDMNVNPPVLVAQVGASVPKTMKPFAFCKDIDGGMANSAWNQFSVFGNGELMKLNQIPNHKLTLLQAPKHGTVVFDDKSRTPVSDIGTAFKSSSLTFMPLQDYAGKDRAMFLVEANKRRYVVTVNFWVMPFITDENTGDTYCKKQDFSLSNKPFQSVSSRLDSADISALLAAASNVTDVFANVAGSFVGQTIGEGTVTQIARDAEAIPKLEMLKALPSTEARSHQPRHPIHFQAPKAPIV